MHNPHRHRRESGSCVPDSFPPSARRAAPNPPWVHRHLGLWTAPPLLEQRTEPRQKQKFVVLFSHQNGIWLHTPSTVTRFVPRVFPLHFSRHVESTQHLLYTPRPPVSSGQAALHTIADVFGHATERFHTSGRSAEPYIRSGTSIPSSAIADFSTRATCWANCRRMQRTSACSSRRIEWSW